MLISTYRVGFCLVFLGLGAVSNASETRAAKAPAAQSVNVSPASCHATVPLSPQMQARSVEFGWQLLPPQTQAGLPPAAIHSQPLTGTVFWPQQEKKSLLPAVVLLHGSGATQCDLFSLAGLLAKNGYVTLTLNQPDNRTASSETSGVEALYSALAFLKSPANPAPTQSDEVALVGHSEGAGVVSMAQGLPGFEAVRAIVALDNLRHWLTGDPGSAVRSCDKKRAGEVTPRVPALGFAKDGPCTATGDTTPEVKLSGWEWWRRNGVASVELVPTGYEHLTFTDRRGNSERI